MGDPFLMTMVRKFLPLIKEKAAPTIEEVLVARLTEYRKNLRDGEENANLIIQMNENNNVEVFAVTTSPDDEILRILEHWTLPELVGILLSNLDKIK